MGKHTVFLVCFKMFWRIWVVTYCTQSTSPNCSIHTPIHLFTHLPTHSLYPSIHLYTHPPTHVLTFLSIHPSYLSVHPITGWEGWDRRASYYLYVWSIGRASLIAQLVKNPPAMQETPFWFLSWEDPLEKGKETHSSILAWRIPRTYSPWGRKEWLLLSLAGCSGTLFSVVTKLL